MLLNRDCNNRRPTIIVQKILSSIDDNWNSRMKKVTNKEMKKE